MKATMRDTQPTANAVGRLWAVWTDSNTRVFTIIAGSLLCWANLPCIIDSLPMRARCQPTHSNRKYAMLESARVWRASSDRYHWKPLAHLILSICYSFISTCSSLPSSLSASIHAASVLRSRSPECCQWFGVFLSCILFHRASEAEQNRSHLDCFLLRQLRMNWMWQS